MTRDPDQWLRLLRERGFAGLLGSTALVRLAVDESLINELLAQEVLPRQPSVRELRAKVLAGNRLDVRIKLASGFLPSVTLKFELDPVVVPAPRPALTFRLRREGVSALLAPALAQFSNRLPPFVRLDADGGAIDLAVLLARGDAEWLLPLVSRADIETLDGQLIVTVDVRV